MLLEKFCLQIGLLLFYRFLRCLNVFHQHFIIPVINNTVSVTVKQISHFTGQFCHPFFNIIPF